MLNPDNLKEIIIAQKLEITRGIQWLFESTDEDDIFLQELFENRNKSLREYSDVQLDIVRNLAIIGAVEIVKGANPDKAVFEAIN